MFSDFVFKSFQTNGSQVTWLCSTYIVVREKNPNRLNSKNAYIWKLEMNQMFRNCRFIHLYLIYEKGMKRRDSHWYIKFVSEIFQKFRISYWWTIRSNLICHHFPSYEDKLQIFRFIIYKDIQYGKLRSLQKWWKY